MSEKDPEQHLPGDTVVGTDAQAFALAFVTQMRRLKTITHPPSLRSTIAIPRFLAARCLRQGGLTPKDYVDAAVMLTPYEDQPQAWEVAREILFPNEDKKPAAAAAGATAQATAQATAKPQAANATQSILDGLADLDINLDDLSALDDIDSLLAKAEDQELSAFDLQEKMLTSTDPTEAAVGQLVQRYGGAGEMQAQGIRSVEGAMELVRELLRGRIGSLDGEEVAEACAAGLGPLLLREVQQPWELAGTLAGSRDFDRLKHHLDDTLAQGTATDIGRTLRFLDPYAGVLTGSEIVAFREVGLSRVKDLSEHAELLDGMRRYLPPPDELIRRSAQENPTRALEAARWVMNRFGENLQSRIFDHWADSLQAPPALETVLDLPVDCPRWERMLHDCYRDWVKAKDESDFLGNINAEFGGILGPVIDVDSAEAPPPSPMFSLPPEPNDSGDWLRIAQHMRETKLEAAKKLSSQVMVDALLRVQVREAFLPLLDTFVDQGFYPSDPKAVVEAGVRLGLPEAAIYERLGRPLEQLTALIEQANMDPERYRRLVEKIQKIPSDLLQQLCGRCVDSTNLCGMAALLAINLGGAAALVPPDFASLSLGHKGIGGGTNLLKQWFDHRQGMTDTLRAKIKEIAKGALMDLAFDWIAKGSGSSEMGMIPQHRSRPYRAGDEMDSLDLDATLDGIISAGKTLDQITEEDLSVPVTAKGRAAMGVLLDISGSMGGRELANCAISVIMLLGKLHPDEIAIALFESDTHVIKGFSEHRDLDEVADRLLELAATGGTRVDQALRWLADQFAEVPEAEFRMMFLLSDFCFFESRADLRTCMLLLSDQDVRYLGAAHGSMDENTASLFEEVMGGRRLKLRDLDAVPALLSEAIQSAGEGW